MDDFTIHPPDSGFTIHPPTSAPLAQSTGLTIHPPESPGLFTQANDAARAMTAKIDSAIEGAGLRKGAAPGSLTPPDTAPSRGEISHPSQGLDPQELFAKRAALEQAGKKGSPEWRELTRQFARANKEQQDKAAYFLAPAGGGIAGLVRGGVSRLTRPAAEASAAAAKPIQGEASTFTISEPSLHKGGAAQPAAPGMVRMYHGESAGAGDKGARWFTSDQKYAQGYAAKSGDGRVSYVDLPEDHPLIAPPYPEQSVRQGFHVNRELPADIAEGRKPFIAADAGGLKQVSPDATPGETMPNGAAKRPSGLTPEQEAQLKAMGFGQGTAKPAEGIATQGIPGAANGENVALKQVSPDATGQLPSGAAQRPGSHTPAQEAELKARGFNEGSSAGAGSPRVKAAAAQRLDNTMAGIDDSTKMPRTTGETIPLRDPVMPEGPLSRAPALSKPREFEDQLHQLSTNTAADAIEATKKTEALPKDATPETMEKLYHHVEDPKGVPLSSGEQKIFDEHIAPIRTERAALSKELEGITGVKQEHFDEYTPRRVKGRTRSLGEVLEQWKTGVEARYGGAAGRSLRKTVDSQKSRKFYNAVNPETGEKQVVWVGPDRSVVAFDGSKTGKELGRLAGSTGPKTGAKVNAGGQTLTLEQATTKEIEGSAKVRYSKNIFANEMDELMKLRSAVRNAKFIEDIKAQPDFERIAVKRGNIPGGVNPDAVMPGSNMTFREHFGDTATTPPMVDGRTWRSPKLAQFQNYYMDPRIADALDDFAKQMDNPENLANTLNKIGRVMNYVMFLNPKAHIDNVFNHMMVDRGLVGNVIGAPRAAKNIIKAAKEVMTAGPQYIRHLRTGAALPYSKMLSGDLHKTLLRKLGGEAERDPHAWNSIAQSFGYLNGKDMIGRWGNIPQRALWAASDIMTLAREMELRDRGISIEQAIKKTEEGMPNYRVPGQVLGKRWIAQIFGSPTVGRFGRYQYGRLRGYGHMLKDAFGKGRSLHDRAEAFDKMAMLGAYMFLFYPVFDKAWQYVTGNDNAKTTRSGAATIPQVALDVINGDKKPGDAAQSIFTLGVPIETPVELYYGRYLWNGQPIIHEADVEAGRYGRVAKDAAGYVASKASQVGQMFDVSQGKKTPRQLLYEAIGVKTPTEEQVEGKAKAKMYEKRNAQKRDMRLTNKASGE